MKESTVSKNQLAREWDSSEITLAARAAQRHVPLGGTFELTPRCNLNCKMCYVRLDTSEMKKIGRERTAKEWIALAREAADEGTLNLLITGGEPLLREDFAEIYTAICQMGFIITLNTNATLMNSEYLDLFKKYPPTATNVTLYGASAETYEKVCGSAAAFYKTIEGLEMLSSIPTELEVRTTFIKDNVGELDEVRRIANKYTKRFAINAFLNKAIRGASSEVENVRLSPRELFDLYKDNAEYYNALNDPEEIALEKNMDTDNHIGVKDYGFDLPPKIITCLAAKSMYWITWDGKMLPCGSFSSPYTLPFEEGFKKAWDRLPGLFEDIELPEKCKTCEFADGKCSNCPAILQSETGSFGTVSEYICAVALERAGRKK